MARICFTRQRHGGAKNSNGNGAYSGGLHGESMARKSKAPQRRRKASHGRATARKIMETPDNAQLTALIIKSIHKKEKKHTMKTLEIKITLLEEMLGTSPNNEDIYRDFIASKAPDASTIEEEVEALGVDAAADKGMTVFSRDEEGRPALYDYHIKGFFKDACSMLRKATGSKSKNLTAHKKMIDGLVFVNPRMIPIILPEGTEIGCCQRPLRASTAKGERVSLSMSESAPAGSTMELEITCLTDGDEEYVREWLDYGVYRGLGQWRNSGKGRFSWEEIRCY